MSKKRKTDNTHEAVFDQITEDLRLAFCAGDLELDDVAPVEMTNSCKHKLTLMLRDWGQQNGVET